MNAVERRCYDMLARVRDFGAVSAADFPVGQSGRRNGSFNTASDLITIYFCRNSIYTQKNISGKKL